MASNSEFMDYLIELMAPLGPVRYKAMFGGYGIYMDDIMFALVADDTLYFKTDDTTIDAYQQRGLKPFQFQRKDKTITMSYAEAPAEVLDDADEMKTWAQQAVAVAINSARR